MTSVNSVSSSSDSSDDQQLLDALKTALGSNSSTTTTAKPTDSSQNLTGIEQLGNMLSSSGTNQASSDFAKLATSLGTDPYSLLAIIKDGGPNSIAKMMQSRSMSAFTTAATSDDPLLDSYSEDTSSNASLFDTSSGTSSSASGSTDISTILQNLGNTGNQFDGLA